MVVVFYSLFENLIGEKIGAFHCRDYRENKRGAFFNRQRKWDERLIGEGKLCDKLVLN